MKQNKKCRQLPHPIPQKKIIHGYKKFKMQANLETQRKDLVRRVEASRFNLKTLRGYIPYPEKDEILDKPRMVLNLSNTIQTLDVDLYSRGHIFTNAGFESVCQSIRGRTSLKHLSLLFGFLTDYCYGTKDVTVTKIKQISGALKTLSSLQTLSLDFHRCRSVTDEGLSELSQALKIIPSLRKLRLCFAGCSEITNMGIESLCKGLRRLESLEMISLNIKECPKIDDPGLQNLGQAFKKLVSLKNFELNLSEKLPSEDDQEEWTRPKIDRLNPGLRAELALANLAPGLKALRLDFSGCPVRKLNNVILENIGGSLKKLISLKEIDLNFAACEAFSAFEMIQIQKILRSLPCLENISLDLTRCGVLTDLAIDGLVQDLRSLQSLKSLYLDLSQCFLITGPGIGQISQRLGQLTMLTDLSLHFSGFGRISDENGLKNLYVCLENLTSLRSINLSLRRWSGKEFQTNRGKVDLGSALKKLKLLQNISLSFSNCGQIDKKGVQNLCAGLKSRNSLQSLSLDLSPFTLFHKDADFLWKAIRTLKSLEKLSIQLCFMNLPEETFLQKGVGSLCDAFKELGSLRNLDLQFPLFDNDCLRPFGEALKALHCLENIRFKYVVGEDPKRYDDAVEKGFRRALMTLPCLKNLSIGSRGRKHWW